MPWRNTRDPYAIWLSEVMLQQTQVKTVLERYYFPFLEKFPTIQDLVAAPRDVVLKAWEGLGYYNRAANLHKAAQLASDGLPDTAEALLTLPGIGRNTANAVASFAFNRAVPVMEANVKRVLCRIFALEEPSVDLLWQKAELLLDKEQPFDYNQAMMDIGAYICTPRAPRCIECPAQEICIGKEQAERYPAAKKKKEVPVRESHVIVCCNRNGEFFLQAREGAFLRGLYEFAFFDAGQNEAPIMIGEANQTYSHFKAIAQVGIQNITSAAAQGKGWFSAQQIEALALSGIDKKIWRLVQNHL